MLTSLSTAFLAIAPIAYVSAHFHLNYPYWRADSLAGTDPSISQWNYPCAGVGQQNSTNNRTAWPLDGGSIQFAGSHPWAFTYVNLGLGANVTNFNISLVEGFNQTGNGSFCWNHVPFDAAANNVTEGSQASIQVIQISHSGASLYNCADIVFSKNATLLSGDQCKNATGVGGVAIQNAGASNTTSSNSSSSSSSTSSSASSSSSSGAGTGARGATGLLVGGVMVGFAALL